MPCFNALPDELLFAIFECFLALRQFAPQRDLESQRRLAVNRLRRTTLLALFRTSGRCKRIVEPLLYSDIVVDDPTTRACERLDDLLRTIIAKPDLAALIQYLEYVPQKTERGVQKRSRPYDRAIDWVASTILNPFEASIFSDDSYGNQLAVSQVALILFLAPNITHLTCSIRMAQSWMETSLLLRALGLRSNLFPEHSGFPPLTSLERVCLLSSAPEETLPSDAPKRMISPSRFTLETVTHIPCLKHLLQSGMQYGLQPSCNFAMLHTICLHDTLVPVTKVIAAVEQCSNLRTFEYSMALKVLGHPPSFDAAALSLALLCSKDTLTTLCLVYSDRENYTRICPVTSFQDFHELKTLSISNCLLLTPFEHQSETEGHLPASIERLSVHFQRDAHIDSSLSRMDALFWYLMDNISRFSKLKTVHCVDPTRNHEWTMDLSTALSKYKDAFAEREIEFTVESEFSILSVH